MNRQEQLDLIRQKCIEINPSILCVDCEGVGYQVEGDHNGEPVQVQCPCHERPIRLADILLAIESSFLAASKNVEEVVIAETGSFGVVRNETQQVAWHPIYWKLRKDNLTEQSDECIKFLAELLI